MNHLGGRPCSRRCKAENCCSLNELNERMCTRSCKKKNCCSTEQSGGRVTMPSEYYGINSGRYMPENGVNMGMDSAYGKTYPTSHGALIGNNLMGPDLGPYPNRSNTQTGGGYEKIVNPVTGRKVNIDSKLGKQIVNNYLQQLGGGKFKIAGLTVIAANKFKNIKELNRRFENLPVSAQQKNRKNLQNAKNLINSGKISIEDNKITIHDDKLKKILDNNQAGGANEEESFHERAKRMYRYAEFSGDLIGELMFLLALGYYPPLQAAYMCKLGYCAIFGE